MAESKYLLSNEWSEQRRRLAGIEALFDPTTLRHLASLGLGPGWNCLELGGGGGSVARWMAEHVGQSGSVLATDLDTRFLDEIDLPNVEVLAHDIQTEPLDRNFDLIHARLVLEHLPERVEVLAKLIEALVPGGWLLIEVGDNTINRHLPAARQFALPARMRSPWRRFFRAVEALGAQAGGDWELGRVLPSLMTNAGLVDIDAEMSSKLVVGGSTRAGFYEFSARQIADACVATGFVTQQDVDVLLDTYTDPRTMFMSTTVVAAWGRRAS
ncbi:MAG TPA: methyltransferase domain-containing protein [Ilumatobacter sp.]|nr:methyltransferase domain-containing protein [Ilumatobacter sp.]